MEEISTNEAFDNIKPDHVVFVISVDEEGKPNGQIAARFLKCSRNPPIIAISIGKKNNTHSLIEKSGEFVVSIANKGLSNSVMIFGKEKGRETDKFKKSKIKTLSAKHIKSPLLKDASANFECKVKKKIDLGQDTLFLGEILASYSNKNKKNLFNFGKGYGDYDFREL